MSSPLMTVMINAARKAARGIQRDFGEIENLQVSRKGPGDFVTNADKRTEKILRGELLKARPAYGFLGEEGGLLNGSDPDHRWIIDPIDGTTNLIHGVPLIAVSIALERKSEVIAGLIYNPIMNELFTAERGAGAFLNGRRLRVSGASELLKSLLVTGFPYDLRDDLPGKLRLFNRLMGEARAIRRDGAAAVDLSYVAAGRVDGFWEEKLSPWDMAAGTLLIEEAGGRVTRFDGTPLGLVEDEIVATNGRIHEVMLAALRTDGSE